MAKSLDRWQGIENHYAFFSRDEYRTENQESEEVSTQPLQSALKDFKFTDGIPLTIFVFEGLYLRNGGRCYTCNNCLEITTPPCPNPISLTIYDKATEYLAYVGAMEASKKHGKNIFAIKSSHEIEPHIHRGAHESYSINKLKIPSSSLRAFLSTRILYSGAGGYIKINGEPRFVVSPRVITEHPHELWREKVRIDEGAGGKGKMRLEILTGDMLKNEYTRAFTNAITSYFISALEDGNLKHIPEISSNTSEELTLNPYGDWKVKLCSAHNNEMKAIDYIRTYFLDAIEKEFQERESKNYDRWLLKKFKFILDRLDEGRFKACSKYVQWLEKLYFLENFELEYKLPQKVVKDYETLYGSEWRKVVADIEFGEVRMEGDKDLHALTLAVIDEDSLIYKIKKFLGLEMDLFENLDKQIVEAAKFPPPNSRAQAMVEALLELTKNKFSIPAVNWGKILYYDPNSNRQEIDISPLDGWTQEKIEELKNEIRKKASTSDG